MMQNYYSILEVPRTATLEQIKRSYRRLVRLYHPDLNQQVRDDRIKQLNEAYNVLSDQARRIAYDIQLLEAMRREIILETLRRQQIQARREPPMTWAQGMSGFVKELKKALRED